MSRIANIFAQLPSEKRKALITFIMAGDPSMQECESLLHALPEAGVDIIELGIPFSDPMADGVSIQEAAKRALAAGATLKKILGLCAGFRTRNTTTPLVLMGYYNSFYAYGVTTFIEDAEKAGIDGLIIVDLPPEESDELAPMAAAADIDFIRLVTPTTNDARLPVVLEGASGFIYYVAVAGVTGTKSADSGSLGAAVKHLKSKTTLPVAVGFGIKTPEHAREAAKSADAVIVGSALVDRFHIHGLEHATNFVRDLAKAIKV